MFGFATSRLAHILHITFNQFKEQVPLNTCYALGQKKEAATRLSFKSAYIWPMAGVQFGDRRVVWFPVRFHISVDELKRTCCYC